MAPTPVFKTPASQPHYHDPGDLASVPVTGGNPMVMVSFGTGHAVPLTNTAPTTYVDRHHQTLYGVWDWNMTAWNLKGSTQYSTLAATTGATGLTASLTVQQTNLQVQTLTINASTGYRYGTANTICWQGSCSPGPGKFGWYVNMPGDVGG